MDNIGIAYNADKSWPVANVTSGECYGGQSIESLHELASQALKAGKIVFSGFRSEEIQELYCYQHSVQEVDE